jgi:hypothetical protein
MRTVENPLHLFQRIDATDINIDDDSFTLPVAETPDDTVTRQKGELTEMEDPHTEFYEALETIQEAAPVVSDESEVPDGADTKLVITEDGEQVEYIANSDSLGYQVVEDKDPLIAAFVVLFDDQVVKLDS